MFFVVNFSIYWNFCYRVVIISFFFKTQRYTISIIKNKKKKLNVTSRLKKSSCNVQNSDERSREKKN